MLASISSVSEKLETWRQWGSELHSVGGRNPLRSFELSSFAHVDLTRAHPSGLAQLVSARTTRISNLIRDGVTGARANSAARRIATKANTLLEDFGLESVFIAGGVLRFPADDIQLPLLIWPTTIGEKSDDYQITLGDEPKLNPEMVFALESRGIFPSQVELIRLAKRGRDLLPMDFLSRISDLVSETDAEVDRLLVLGNFLPQLCQLQQAFDYREHTLLDLVASESQIDEPQIDTDPNLILVADADANQKHIISRVISGHSFAVETLPGCGYTQLVVNIVSSLTLQSKRTLIVAPRRQTLDELSERLNELGLNGLVVRAHSSWLDVIGAISRFEKAAAIDYSELLESADKTKLEVSGYFESLNQRHPELSVNLLEVITKLADLSAQPLPPTNSARIPIEKLTELHNSQTAIGLLQSAGASGLFSFGPKDTDWFGSQFDTLEEIATAVTTAKELVAGEFESIRQKLIVYLSEIRLKQAVTVEDLSIQVKLLLGIRETLDRFKPEIYDRPLGDLITATAPRHERKEMSGAQRRRFRKVAKDFLRAGSNVVNLHNALAEAQKQRELWFSLSDTNSPPTVPLGLAEIAESFQMLADKITLLQRHLNPDPGIELLSRMPFDQLEVRLSSLAKDTEILENLLERKTIEQQLQDSGLGELAKQLSTIQPNSEKLLDEFDQAWWQSAFEAVLDSNSALLEYDNEVIADIESRFANASNQVVTAGAAKLNLQQAKNWKQALENTQQAQRLKEILRTREAAPKNLVAQAPNIWPVLASALSCSPLELSAKVHEEDEFDVVLVLDSAGSGMAENAMAISKAKQLVVFGDPVIASPANFETSARSANTEPASDRESCFQAVSAVFGSEAISRSYRSRGQVLGDYINREFYAERIELIPTAENYLGTQNYRLEIVSEGNLASSTIEGATESSDGELARVLELVIGHARFNPAQSLLVATASRVHAERVGQALAQRIKKQPEIAEFFEAHGRERFQITTLSDLGHRIADRIIFSIGFSKTQAGKVSGHFGEINSLHGELFLANLIVSARQQFTVVSCFAENELPGTSKNPEIRHLRQLLAPDFKQPSSDASPDPLMRDLALRLQKLGLRVANQYAGSLHLVASYGSQACVIDADWHLVGDGWDELIRVRPKLYQSMGWLYHRVHALEIFAQPQDVAARIATLLGAIDLAPRYESLDVNHDRDDLDSNDQRLRDDKPPHWG